VREGAAYFAEPAGPAQRRYEALRAYFLDEMPAAEVADRFGYSTSSVHQMATLLRKGRLSLFAEARPGPKGPRKATGRLRARALELRTAGHSVTEIAAALTGEGMPVSAQTVWQILDGEGLPRLGRRDEGRRGPPARLVPVKAAALPGWPATPVSLPCGHAGLLLLLPALCEVGLPDLVAAAGYPSTRELSAWQSIGTLLLAKCARNPRVSHAGTLADDEGLAFFLGLTALPKTTQLAGLVAALRPLGLATGEAGFNCDFHAIRHHGDQAVLGKRYVPRRSQRTPSGNRPSPPTPPGHRRSPRPATAPSPAPPPARPARTAAWWTPNAQPPAACSTAGHTRSPPGRGAPGGSSAAAAPGCGTWPGSSPPPPTTAAAALAASIASSATTAARRSGGSPAQTRGSGLTARPALSCIALTRCR
jgi:transposase